MTHHIDSSGALDIFIKFAIDELVENAGFADLRIANQCKFKAALDRIRRILVILFDAVSRSPIHKTKSYQLSKFLKR